MEMKARRELDAVIAKNVFGCDVGSREDIIGGKDLWVTEPGKGRSQYPPDTIITHFCKCSPIHTHNNEDDGQIRHYSSSLDAAWSVVNQIEKQGYPNTFGELWPRAGTMEFNQLAYEICLAGLKSVGVDL